ncbi:energy transducer TonB [Lysobacter niastensis]|uniref:Energy transducer TonB n=1 Tax=Lysobacter niastensis TaxID=380629 RepID=A0ABS0B519_9GAMM|nr:energy transducer TonB [Lysobacter niastensis]MBF6023043.1 energy transducer TonB [Lysobacter niastensis]
MKGWWLGLLLAMSTCAIAADKHQEVRSQLEASTLLTGTIDIGPDGRVVAHAIDQVDRLPQAVVRLVDRLAKDWTFEPVRVDGRVVKARVKMSLRVGARSNEAGQTVVWLRNAFFGEELPGEEVASKKLSPPEYPGGAARAGVSATAYVVVKVGRDGRVEDSFIEQVNVRAVAKPSDMPLWREMFAKTTLRAASYWKFLPPTKGPEVDAPFWLVRVPVDYVMRGETPPAYGQWQAYVPGPVQRAPWLPDRAALAGGPDALPPGGVYSANAGLKLLTPLGGS